MALLGQLTVGILGDLSGYSSSLTAAQKETVKFSKGIERMGKDISTIGYGFQDLGGKLTKTITAPALTAAGAVAGITAALGWKRLVGLDTAQAQLKGLGYEGKDVDRIMEQVTSAIDGGMTTAAEGTAIAAGALAAGVKEGKELERYITLVGDAAVGANRPVDEMAMIFNRVQGSGKLMTRELNMIEQGMPGFTLAMAESLGVAPEKLSEMVTAGQVSSEEFLDVMDDFAGGMAEAYSQSWAGMVKNTAAYVGIIGENLLEGVFQMSKEEIANFIEVLKSDAIMDWAKRTGEAIHNAFQAVVDKVREMKKWYDDLSPAMQDLTKKIALFGSIGAVAIGPILLVIGKLIVTVGTLVTRFGAIMGAVTKLGGVFGILTGPIGIVIGIIAALIAVGVLLYKNWDTVKEKAQNVFSSFSPLLEIVKGAFQNLLDSVGPIMDSLKGLWESLLPLLEKIGLIIAAVVVPAFGILVSVFSAVMAAIGPFVNAIINFIDIVVNIVNALIALFMGDFTGALEYWQQASESTVEFVKNLWETVKEFFVTLVMSIIEFFHNLYMTLVGNSIIPDMVNAIVEWFQNMWNWLVEIVSGLVDSVVKYFTNLYEKASEIFQAFWGILTDIWGYIQNTFQNALDFILALVSGDFEGMKTAMQNQMENARSLLSNIWERIKGLIGDKASAILTDIVAKFIEIKNNMQNKINEAKNAVVKKFTEIVTGIRKKASEVVSTVRTKFNDAKDKITEPIEKAKETISGIIDDIKGFFDNLKLKIPKPEMPSMPSFSLKTSSEKIMGKSITYPSGIGVNWNALGGIFKRPTIFNTANAGMQGVGEAGAEAIIPLTDKVLGGIGEGVAKTMPGNQDLINLLTEQNNILMRLLNKNQDLYMEERVVGSILSPIIDENLERERRIRERFRG